MPAETSLPHFWPILEAMPYGLLYKESAKPQILANKAALQLFNLPLDNGRLSVSSLSHVELLDPDTQQKINLLHNPLLQALSGTALSQQVLIHLPQPMLINILSQSIKLDFSLGETILINLSTQHQVTARLPGAVTELSELQEALAFDKLMSLISTELINVDIDKLDQHIEDALAALGEFCHADRSYIFLFNSDITEMSNTHEWVREHIAPHKDNLQQIPKDGLPYFFERMLQDHIFAVADVSQLTEQAAAERAEFEAEDIQSVLCCAMFAGKQLLGFVGCDMVARQRNWTANDLRRIKLVGEMIANSIQNVNYRRSLQDIQLKLLSANQELQKQASQDGLTGIANRRHFDEKLAEELQRSARHQQPLGLILLDIDLFKPYNDHYGHQAGDLALQQVAQALSAETKRQGELAARYGGEEFALILPGSDIKECQQLAKRLQKRLAALDIAHVKSDISPHLTVSQGCVSVIADKEHNAATLLQAADKALYQAKANGRNCIVTAP
ncbi:sensor domain-containing diguanylate cyclase [Arsukibacterium sp.]|uniref:sensor domain-containing diguanylate cyclase n=1 Tax=Arsukibacterium sp. TaxID=1977258 RepID=UPI002FDA95A3